jgi:hypothetical protein
MGGNLLAFALVGAASLAQRVWWYNRYVLLPVDGAGVCDPGGFSQMGIIKEERIGGQRLILGDCRLQSRAVCTSVVTWKTKN